MTFLLMMLIWLLIIMVFLILNHLNIKLLLLEKQNNTSSSVKNAKMANSLKYLSNFWRSLWMPLIKFKVHLELICIEDCVLSSAGDSAKFKITDAKLLAPITILSTKHNVNLTKHLRDGFKKSIYWNIYRAIPTNVIEKEKKHSYLVHRFKVLKDYLILLILLLQLLILMKKHV